MRVLAVCPMPRVNDAAIYYGRAMKSIFRQDYEGQIDYFCQSGDGTLDGDRYDRVTAKYEQARWMCLEQDYDAMWCVEYDMIVPPCAVRKLLDVDADIAYGLYCWRWAPYHWSAYVHVGSEFGVSLSQMPDRAREAWGKTISVEGVGQGCTLIKREVLKQITFHRAGEACADWYLARDAQRLGLSQKCDTSVVCGHTGYTPRPFTVWPSPHTKPLFVMEVHDESSL